MRWKKRILRKCKTRITVESLSSYALIFYLLIQKTSLVKFRVKDHTPSPPLPRPFQNKMVVKEVTLIICWCVPSIIGRANFTFKSTSYLGRAIRPFLYAIRPAAVAADRTLETPMNFRRPPTEGKFLSQKVV